MKRKLRRDQRGVAHMALIAVLVLLAVGGAGYYVWSKQKKDKSSPAQTVANQVAEAECKKAIEDKDLCKMASSFDFEKGNYVITISGEQDGEQYSWTIQNDGGNSQSNFLGLETITHDGVTYMKQAGGEWVKYPASEEEEDETISETFDFSEEEASWYTKVGKEPCGNLTCFHYSYKDPNDASNNAEFWFDDKDYRIRKVTSAVEDGVTAEMVVTYGNAKVSPPEDFTDASM